jgi:hypothetical protein
MNNEKARADGAGGFIGIERMSAVPPLRIPVSAGNRQASFRQSSAGSA